MNKPLLTPELIASLSGLELKARTVVESALSGQHRSRRKGFSSQFAEHREYSPGDDLRYIDWKVFGKHDRYYVKQFEDETRLRAWIILDNSRSMYYRSEAAPLAKLEYASILAAAISWLILKQRDEVGLSLVGESISTLPPHGHPVHLKQVLTFLEHQVEKIPDRQQLSEQATSPVHALDPVTPLHELAEQIPPRGLLIWLTDAFLDQQQLEKILRHWLHFQHDIRLIHIVDPAESEFPFEEPTLFRGLEEGSEQTLPPRSIKAAYLAEWKAFLQTTERTVRRLDCDYLFATTGMPLDQLLRQWLFS